MTVEIRRLELRIEELRFRLSQRDATKWEKSYCRRMIHNLSMRLWGLKGRQ